MHRSMLYLRFKKMSALDYNMYQVIPATQPARFLSLIFSDDHHFLSTIVMLVDFHHMDFLLTAYTMFDNLEVIM